MAIDSCLPSSHPAETATSQALVSALSESTHHRVWRASAIPEEGERSTRTQEGGPAPTPRAAVETVKCMTRSVTFSQAKPDNLKPDHSHYFQPQQTSPGLTKLLVLHNCATIPPLSSNGKFSRAIVVLAAAYQSPPQHGKLHVRTRRASLHPSEHVGGEGWCPMLTSYCWTTVVLQTEPAGLPPKASSPGKHSGESEVR